MAHHPRRNVREEHVHHGEPSNSTEARNASSQYARVRMRKAMRETLPLETQNGQASTQSIHELKRERERRRQQDTDRNQEREKANIYHPGQESTASHHRRELQAARARARRRERDPSYYTTTTSTSSSRVHRQGSSRATSGPSRGDPRSSHAQPTEARPNRGTSGGDLRTSSGKSGKSSSSRRHSGEAPGTSWRNLDGDGEQDRDLDAHSLDPSLDPSLDTRPLSPAQRRQHRQQQHHRQQPAYHEDNRRRDYSGGSRTHSGNRHNRHQPHDDRQVVHTSGPIHPAGLYQQPQQPIRHHAPSQPYTNAHHSNHHGAHGIVDTDAILPEDLYQPHQKSREPIEHGRSRIRERLGLEAGKGPKGRDQCTQTPTLETNFPELLQEVDFEDMLLGGDASVPSPTNKSPRMIAHPNPPSNPPTTAPGAYHHTASGGDLNRDIEDKWHDHRDRGQGSQGSPERLRNQIQQQYVVQKERQAIEYQRDVGIQSDPSGDDLDMGSATMTGGSKPNQPINLHPPSTTKSVQKEATKSIPNPIDGYPDLMVVSQNTKGPVNVTVVKPPKPNTALDTILSSALHDIEDKQSGLGPMANLECIFSAFGDSPKAYVPAPAPEANPYQESITALDFLMHFYTPSDRKEMDLNLILEVQKADPKAQPLSPNPLPSPLPASNPSPLALDMLIQNFEPNDQTGLALTTISAAMIDNQTNQDPDTTSSLGQILQAGDDKDGHLSTLMQALKDAPEASPPIQKPSKARGGNYTESTWLPYTDRDRPKPKPKPPVNHPDSRKSPRLSAEGSLLGNGESPKAPPVVAISSKPHINTRTSSPTTSTDAVPRASPCHSPTRLEGISMYDLPSGPFNILDTHELSEGYKKADDKPRMDKRSGLDSARSRSKDRNRHQRPVSGDDGRPHSQRSRSGGNLNTGQAFAGDAPTAGPHSRTRRGDRPNDRRRNECGRSLSKEALDRAQRNAQRGEQNRQHHSRDKEQRTRVRQWLDAMSDR